MKRILLIMILFVFGSQLYSQNTDKATTPSGAPYSGDAVLWRAFEKTLEALRIKIVSGSITAAPDTTNLATIAGGDDSLTVTTENDTIMAPTGATTWWTFDLTNIHTVADSTIIEWSFDGFVSQKRQLFPTQSFYTKERLSVAAFPYVIIRRKSASGIGRYDITTFGY